MADVGHNFFMIRFGDNKDYNKVVMSGPWMVFGHYLMIQPENPTFEP